MIVRLRAVFFEIRKVERHWHENNWPQEECELLYCANVFDKLNNTFTKDTRFLASEII